MVDATKGIGGIQNLPSSHSDRNKAEAKKSEARPSIEPQDEVEISDEAAELANAAQAARAVRGELERDAGAILSKPGALERIDA